MTTNQILDHTGDAYLALIHPDIASDTFQDLVRPLLVLAPSVPAAIVGDLIVGPSWRERLLGVYFAMATTPELHIGRLIESLHDLRGMSIVPTIAALAVMARNDCFEMTKSFGDQFDRFAFDGEVGWAVDWALHHVGLREHPGAECGPNYGQRFDAHTRMFEALHSA